MNQGPGQGDTHGLTVALMPVLRHATGDRLGEVNFFRSMWQRGGAETALSTYRLDSGETVPVIVKLPVGPNEFRWTTLLGGCDQSRWHDLDQLRLATPRVLASGLEIGGYDLAWMVIERLGGQPLHGHLTEESVIDLLAAAADFQAMAESRVAIDMDSPLPRSPDWEGLIERAKAVSKSHAVPDWNEWSQGIRRVQKVLSSLVSRWEARPKCFWCHGDLHPGNALRRVDPAIELGAKDRHGMVLFDLALVHRGHWVEDALYLERQFWGHSEQLCGVKPVGTLARLRRERNLPTDDLYSDLVNLRRVLMAACAPAVLEKEGGDAKYLQGALEVLRKYLPQVEP